MSPRSSASGVSLNKGGMVRAIRLAAVQPRERRRARRRAARKDGANRTTQPRPALEPSAVADQFAADDPVVLGLRAAADRDQPRRPEASAQHGVAKDRIHARSERGRIGGEAAVGAAGVLTDEQHRRSVMHRGERALQGDADPELPVLAIGDAGEEAAGLRTASPRSSRCPPLANRLRTSRRCRMSPEGGMRVAPVPANEQPPAAATACGAASRVAARRDSASGASQSSASRNSRAAPPPQPSPAARESERMH